MRFSPYKSIPNLIAIPKWSEIKEVYEAVINYCEKINGHWYAYVYADIPILDGITKIDTITKAKDWASTNGYDKFKSKVFWPQYRYNNGNVYHASILAMAETLRTDLENNNIPMESCSNKILPKGSQYFGEDSTNRGFDEREGNLLNEVGITTIIKRGGQSYIWGPHTAGFESGDDGNAKDGIDQIAIFDTNIRMQYYILNNFQSRWASVVDGPISVNMRDSIISAEQEQLDILVTKGALIGDPKVFFVETENTVEDLVNGNFKWNFIDTPTPPLKSITGEASYTDAGFETYYIEEE